ncbi:MAG TPA: hypothetical protein VMW84_01940 [Acidobacteriota bacterium]|nr:hypothetical protein [Acidobacteriota bacterium]
MVFNYEARARAWFDRAKKEDDEFVKFILFYISIEVSVKRNYRHIRSIKENTTLKDVFFKSISIGKILELKKVLDVDARATQNTRLENGVRNLGD